ncbi:MAG: DUF1830 domain-containing protein [Stigonema ocellatum SAG 48.90 = DSM 106950]|nr:DUF1830 domain-containing protein [Stigonema ocellatum SAG 48.90 = DSM 106950]
MINSSSIASCQPILCHYCNVTSQIQIARISNIPNWYFERVVFPGQHLLFEAVPKAQLEIHTGMMATAIVSDTILCQRLQVEGSDKATKSLYVVNPTPDVPELSRELVAP